MNQNNRICVLASSLRISGYPYLYSKWMLTRWCCVEYIYKEFIIIKNKIKDVPWIGKTFTPKLLINMKSLEKI